MLAEMTGANEKYRTKRYTNVHIAFIIQMSLERVCHVEKYLKRLDFLLPSYCRILSIFTFILSFRKNKYQIQSYSTFNMDDSKRSIYMKTCRCVFLNKQEVLSRFFWKSNIFNIVTGEGSFDAVLRNDICLSALKATINLEDGV